jgi:hypothetical protein
VLIPEVMSVVVIFQVAQGDPMTHVIVPLMVSPAFTLTGELEKIVPLMQQFQLAIVHCPGTGCPGVGNHPSTG